MQHPVYCGYPNQIYEGNTIFLRQVYFGLGCEPCLTPCDHYNTSKVVALVHSVEPEGCNLLIKTDQGTALVHRSDKVYFLTA